MRTPTNLNIEANISGGVESVVFGLNATPSYATVNTAPYTLGGTNGADYLAWSYALNQPYSLTATPYDADDGGGMAGSSLTIMFTIMSG